MTATGVAERNSAQNRRPPTKQRLLLERPPMQTSRNQVAQTPRTTTKYARGFRRTTTSRDRRTDRSTRLDPLWISYICIRSTSGLISLY